MWSPTRREFLGVCAVTVSGAHTASQQIAAPSSPTYVYASESVAPGSSASPFVVGFLITRRVDVHVRALATLKTKTGYRRELKYRSNDTTKVGCAREYMRYFANEPDLRFVARVWAPTNDMPDRFKASQYPLLFKAADLPSSAIVRLKHRRREWGYGKSRGTGQAEVQARIKALNGVAAEVQEISHLPARSTNFDTLVELSNLLTGSLFGLLALETRPLHRGPRWNPLKADIAERLRSALGIKDLLTPTAGNKWKVTRDGPSRGAFDESLPGIGQ